MLCSRATIGFFSGYPRYRHLAHDQALLKLSFSHPGQLVSECRRRTQEELAALPPNMRNPLDCPRERSPVSVRLALDGNVLAEREIAPAGLSRDGSSTIYARFPVPPGTTGCRFSSTTACASPATTTRARKTCTSRPGRSSSSISTRRKEASSSDETSACVGRCRTRADSRERLVQWPAHYRLAVAADARRRLATGWLLLGVSALVASGVFSVLLVLSRTPGLKELFPVADFFRVALVVHVDLSVLVWFVAFAGVFWSLAGSRQWLLAGRAALLLCALGTLGMVVAPFLGSARPVMANYVPVLDGPLFLAGLLVFGAAPG